MIRAFKYLLRPTVKQQRALEAMLKDHCELYNAALEERRTAWSKCRERVGYFDQCGQLKDVRRDDPEGQGRWAAGSQQATLRRLDHAYTAYFRRCSAGRKPGHPRFRSARRFDSVTWPQHGNGCGWDPNRDDPVTRVRLLGVGHVRVHRHRPLEGRIKTITVKREGRRWYIVLACEIAVPEPWPKTGRAIGLDLGITRFATTSAGEHVPNPKHLEASAAKIAEAQRALAAFPARVPYSERTKRHRLASERAAKLHRRVARQRTDFAHKTALDLVRRFDVIAVEALNVQGMTRRVEPRPDPDRPGDHLANGAAAKAALNRKILDAGWRQFLNLLAYKAAWAGREVKAVNPAYTSQKCPRQDCGYTCGENRHREVFHCTRCGYHDHADRVGAMNVASRAGLVRFDGAHVPPEEVEPMWRTRRDGVIIGADRGSGGYLTHPARCPAGGQSEGTKL
ncbi:RNA-guided endonuclease InsQ/TnpB family protein [Glycomyces dulcitolivorans]|uniref:RNA-guided endonuclease InsQ/TnpB family protein n=1 Tax=Glycomyces dulcitolivorans TaxID=2200759 RepID=UPI0018E58DD7|nr:RNA-guided endonuclease TnpB family protein [Glycomyces dulcitolivorans]